MKKVTTQSGIFGPYNTIEILNEVYQCDDICLPFTVIGQGEISDVIDGDFPLPFTTPSDAQTAEQAQTVREERNVKLSDTDWTQLTDAPVDKAVWATYRQALRDVTAQSGFPWTITWPHAPQ